MSERVPSGTRSETNPLRRTLDLCVFAPVGMAVTAVEDLPELIDKGRRRVELQLANARVVGKFVVTKTERRVADRIGTLLRNGSPIGPNAAARDPRRAARRPRRGLSPMRRPVPSWGARWPTTTR